MSLVRLGKDAEQIHAAADSGYQESAQRVYELLLRVLAGYRDVAPHGMVISLTDVSAGDHKAGNSEFRCQSVYQYMYGCVRSPGWPFLVNLIPNSRVSGPALIRPHFRAEKLVPNQISHLGEAWPLPPLA